MMFGQVAARALLRRFSSASTTTGRPVSELHWRRNFPALSVATLPAYHTLALSTGITLCRLCGRESASPWRRGS